MIFPVQFVFFYVNVRLKKFKPKIYIEKEKQPLCWTQCAAYQERVHLVYNAELFCLIFKPVASWLRGVIALCSNASSYQADVVVEPNIRDLMFPCTWHHASNQTIPCPELRDWSHAMLFMPGWKVQQLGRIWYMFAMRSWLLPRYKRVQQLYCLPCRWECFESMLISKIVIWDGALWV
jgi:hypothetical protein